MKEKLKIAAQISEIFSKSILFVIVIVAALVALSTGMDLIKTEGINPRSLVIILSGLCLVIFIFVPGSPVSHHNLICIPSMSRKKSDELSAQKVK